MLESRNSIPFFSYLPIEMAKLKPREILPRQNNIYIYIYIYTLLFVYIYIYLIVFSPPFSICLDVGWNILWSVWYNLTSEQSAILQLSA